MTPRQARRERREAERKAKKLALKKSRTAAAHELADCEASLRIEPAEIGFVSQKPASRADINRANAQFSTGPTSPQGKLASSRNSTRHGLASGVLLLPGEDAAAFDALRHDLFEEHQPADSTEALLVEQLAQSFWLSQRAIRLQSVCFTENGVNEKQLALFLRYQTTHERVFYKALKTLLKLKKAQRPAANGFVSQQRPQPSPQTGFVSQNDPPGAPALEFVRQNRRKTNSAPSFKSQQQAA